MASALPIANGALFPTSQGNISFLDLVAAVNSGGQDGPFLQTENAAEQTVLGPVNFLSEITVPSGTINLGAIAVKEAGDHIQIDSAITNDEAFILDRSFDETGSMDIFSNKLGPKGIIETINVTGTPITISDGLQLAGASGPGIDAYQGSLKVIALTEIVNLSWTARVNSFDGPVTTAVKNFNSGPVPPEGMIVEIPLTNLNRVNPETTYYTTFSVEQSFDLDGGEVAPSIFLPWQQPIGWNVLESQRIAFADEITTSINVGSGSEIALPQAGNELPFKSILQGTGIIITEQADTITIDNSGSMTLIPLTHTRYVDSDTISTSRDGSAANPYNSISEAMSSITDATISKRYTLKVSVDTGFSFVPKPFISIAGDSRDAVIVGTIDIQNTDGDYEFDNLISLSVTGTALTGNLLINFRNCVIQGGSNIFTVSTTSTEVIFTDTIFLNKLDIRQIPCEFRGNCRLEDFEIIDFTLTTFDYVFDGVTFTGAFTTSGSAADNSGRFVNCNWLPGATFSTAWTFNVTTDSNSFPFHSAANVVIVDRISLAELSSYDNSGSNLLATNVNDAIDELDAKRNTGGAYSMSDVAVTTSIPAVDTPTKIATGGADTGYELEGFSHTSNRLTKTSVGTSKYLVVMTSSGNNAAAGTNDGRIHLYKNSSPLPIPVSSADRLNAGDNDSATVTALVPISQGHFIENWIENITNGEDYECVDLNVTVTKWRE